jgi:hypothetical protein
MRTLFFSLLLSAGVVLAGQPAGAAPISGGAVNAGQADPLVMVRDGCGRGRHFSKWRGVCVWNGSEAPAPAYRYYRPYPYYAPPPYYYYGPGYYRPGFGIYYGW